jgi:hypothetical protein
MSSNKFVDLNDLPYIESYPNLLHQEAQESSRKLKSSRNHMIAPINSNLNGLQSSHELRESLLLITFYTMFDVGFVILLTRNHCCLLPNGIPS